MIVIYHPLFLVTFSALLAVGLLAVWAATGQEENPHPVVHCCRVLLAVIGAGTVEVALAVLRDAFTK